MTAVEHASAVAMVALALGLIGALLVAALAATVELYRVRRARRLWPTHACPVRMVSSIVVDGRCSACGQRVDD